MVDRDYSVKFLPNWCVTVPVKALPLRLNVGLFATLLCRCDSLATCTVSLDSSDTRRRGGGSDTQGRVGRAVVALPSPLGPAVTAQLTRSGSLGLSNFRG